MWNRIDATLNPTDIQDIIDAIGTIKAKLSFTKTLSIDQRRKGGWHLTDKASVLFDDVLVAAKLAPGNYPQLNIAEFERDIKLIKQLAGLESQVANLQNLLKDTRRLLAKDAAEQSLYVYGTLKVFHDKGIPGGESFTKLQERMNRTGKKVKRKKAIKP